MGITITDVKVVGICSKHRKSDDEILRYKDGTIIHDKDIACLTEALNSEEGKHGIHPQE